MLAYVLLAGGVVLLAGGLLITARIFAIGGSFVEPPNGAGISLIGSVLASAAGVALIVWSLTRLGG